ncbi:MAG TPA: porin [Patescibacteria group bacterium]|nr:porin [Patescibacteria group bacterium]
MKKILLAGTAIVGAAVLAAPAKADLKIDLGGHFRGYAVYSDQDEADTAAGGDELDNFGFRRDMEVDFTGETTTDSGLTVGVHAELDLGNEGFDGTHFVTPTDALNSGVSGAGFGPETDGNQLDEAYLYFSGGWGRVNFGSEDGAAYLLQVAAPSADSNVDGMRVYVQALNSDVWDDGIANNGTVNFGANAFNLNLGYDNAQFRDTDRLTYLTPKWNGFQAGVSYAPEAGQQLTDGSFAPFGVDDTTGSFDDLWEVAARWDGEFEGFGISLGAGYASASTEVDAAAGAFGSDDISSWDAGLNVSFNDFSIGAAYLDQETGVEETAAGDTEITTWVVGAAWDNGPYHLGATWYSTDIGANVYGITSAAVDEIEIDRWAVGGGYTYGPGMTFRGSVAFGDVETGAAAGDTDFIQVGIGTDVNF